MWLAVPLRQSFIDKIAGGGRREAWFQMANRSSPTDYVVAATSLQQMDSSITPFRRLTASYLCSEQHDHFTHTRCSVAERRRGGEGVTAAAAYFSQCDESERETLPWRLR